MKKPASPLIMRDLMSQDCWAFL